MPANSTPELLQNIQALRAQNTMKIAYTGTAGVISNAVTASIVRIVCTTAAYIAFGSNPTATAADMYIGADTPEYFRITPGHKVSAVQVAAGGTLHVTEMD